MKWQPIETAPKDKWPILVTYVPATTRPPVNAVCWPRSLPKPSDSWRIWGAMNRRLRYEPTHWMPLPAPPEDAGT